MLLDIVWRNIPESFFIFNTDKPEKNGNSLVKVELVQNQSRLLDRDAMAEKKSGATDFEINYLDMLVCYN